MIEIQVYPEHVQVVKKKDICYHSTRNDKEIASIDVNYNPRDIAQEILEILAYHNIECEIVED